MRPLCILQHLLPVQKMNAIAYEVLGYDLLDLCMNGSEKTLNQTQYSQPVRPPPPSGRGLIPPPTCLAPITVIH